MSSKVVTTLESSFAPAEAVRLGTWLGSETSLPKDAKSGWEKGLETADEEDRPIDDPLASEADLAGFGWDDDASDGASRGDCALDAADT